MSASEWQWWQFVLMMLGAVQCWQLLALCARQCRSCCPCGWQRPARRWQRDVQVQTIGTYKWWWNPPRYSTIGSQVLEFEEHAIWN